MVVGISSPTPAAALAIGAIGATLREGACVERTVRRALRTAARERIVVDADSRSAVASAIFGVSVLRARLWRLLAAARADGGRFESAGRPPAYVLALFLLHETAQRARPEALQRVLPTSSLGVPAADLSRLAALDVGGVRWPASSVRRLASYYSLPVGLARSWVSQLGEEEARSLAASANKPGPVVLRANVARLSRAELVRRLEEGGVECEVGALAPWSVRLSGGREAYGGSVWSLAEWRAGLFEVMDEGSQLVVESCAAREGEAVLDLCAGNGGKTLALAAAVGSAGSVLAHDVVSTRLAALRASAERAGVAGWVATAESSAGGDGREASDGALREASRIAAPLGHDCVLVDAPCSSSGTLRRHPGLRWGGQWSGIGRTAEALPALQGELLRQAARHVADGGRLVYATCSLNPAENDDVADAFERWAADGGLGAGRAVAAWPFEAGSAGRHDAPEQSHRRTLWPHLHGTDGFFIARYRVESIGDTRLSP